MPVTKSARKSLRRDKRRALVNQPIRSKYKSAVKKARLEPKAENIRLACIFLDKAAKKRIIHKNKAARLKSRLSKLIKVKK